MVYSFNDSVLQDVMLCSSLDIYENLIGTNFTIFKNEDI
jgi:hypothetical protein